MNITPRSDGRFEVGDRIFSTEAEAKAYADSAAPSKKKPTPLWANIAALAIVGYIAVSCFGGTSAPPFGSSSAGTTYDDALQKCQSRISMANGALQNVPRTHNRGTGGEYLFFWENANPGGSPPVEASCTVDTKTGRITSLILNGKTVM